VLTGARAVAKRRRTGGSERRWLELIARVKEGAKELGREGMRCGEGQGSHHPFIAAGGAPGRGGRGRGGGGGGNGGVNDFNALEDGARLRGGIKGGVMVGRVTARGGIPRCGAGRRGEWWEAVAARPSSGGAGGEG
jgi:hypothetical protein